MEDFREDLLNNVRLLFSSEEIDRVIIVESNKEIASTCRKIIN